MYIECGCGCQRSHSAVAFGEHLTDTNKSQTPERSFDSV